MKRCSPSSDCTKRYFVDITHWFFYSFWIVLFKQNKFTTYALNVFSTLCRLLALHACSSIHNDFFILWCKEILCKEEKYPLMFGQENMKMWAAIRRFETDVEIRCCNLCTRTDTQCDPQTKASAPWIAEEELDSVIHHFAMLLNDHAGRNLSQRKQRHQVLYPKQHQQNRDSLLHRYAVQNLACNAKQTVGSFRLLVLNINPERVDVGVPAVPSKGPQPLNVATQPLGSAGPGSNHPVQLDSRRPRLNELVKPSSR